MVIMVIWRIVQYAAKSIWPKYLATVKMSSGNKDKTNVAYIVQTQHFCDFDIKLCDFSLNFVCHITYSSAGQKLEHLAVAF